MKIGPLPIEPALGVAPMAGMTDTAFRRLVKRNGGCGLVVTEMVSSEGLVRGIDRTLEYAEYTEAERPVSIQIFGGDPARMADAAQIVEGMGANVVDINMGCPVPKISKHHAGCALMREPSHAASIVSAMVKAVKIPVTVKMRAGWNDQEINAPMLARMAEDVGAAAITVHGRTAAQAYSGEADWSAIASLVDHVRIPVLGNGDIWEAGDALRMVAETGCAGVIVGRGCLGRPWLFRDLAIAFSGGEALTLPTLGEVAAVMRRHAELLSELMGAGRGMRDMRKHMAWYLKGFPVGGELRAAFGTVSSMAELNELLGQLDHEAPFPVRELGAPRGRQGSAREKVVLPEGWLDDTDGCDTDLADAELGVSGG